MNGVQKAIFPGMMVGVLVLIGLTNLIGLSPAVLAATGEAQTAFLAADTNETYTNALPIIAGETNQPQEAQQPEEQPAEEPPAPAEADQPEEESQQGCSINDSFPQAVLQWCELIDRQAAEQGLDANLLAALIVQESGGNPNAYSRSGAVGLMQVMPRDGIAASFMCANGPCFASRPSMAELYDPEYNVQYGARMLAGLVQKHGSVRDALYAYGPANVGYYYADKVLAIYASHQ